MGVIIVREERSHPPQILASDEWVYGEEVLAETYIAGRELTCAVLGDRALGVTEIKPVSGEWYDFDAKYAGGGSIHVLPADLKLNIYQRVQELALTAHQALGCRGVSVPTFVTTTRRGVPAPSSSSRSTRSRDDPDEPCAGDRGPRRPEFR